MIIYAILDGIENRTALPHPIDDDVLQAQGEIKEKPDSLPDSLEKARIEASKSSLVQRFIPAPVTQLYCADQFTPTKAR